MTDSMSFTNYSKMCSNIAYWLIDNKKSFKKRDVYGYQKTAAKYDELVNIIRKGKNQSNGLINEFVECAVYDNIDLSFLPNYVIIGNDKIYKNTFVDMINRVSAYEVLNGRSPATVRVTVSSIANATDATLKAFVDAFGSVSTIDEALSKIKGKGYKYYYNSVYNTATTISRIKKGQGVNCTDSSQLFYRIGIALGYEVRFIHVQCSSGGHIRLQLKHSKHTDEKWINRDPACVLSGNSVSSIWCSSRKIIATDPKWIFSDLYS